MKIGEESIIQIQVCEWLNQCTDLPFYHFANEGKRTYANASILKRMGLKAGVSDLFIPRGTDNFHGLFLELKSKNGKLTDTQLNFMNEMIKEGFGAHVAYSSSEAIQIIKAFYSLQPEPQQQ